MAKQEELDEALRIVSEPTEPINPQTTQQLALWERISHEKRDLHSRNNSPSEWFPKGYCSFSALRIGHSKP
jgi:hypothetical protein